MNSVRLALRIAAGVLAAAGIVWAATVLGAGPRIVATAINVAHALHLTGFDAQPFRLPVASPYSAVDQPDPLLPIGLHEVRRPGRSGLVLESGVMLRSGRGPARRAVFRSRLLVAPRPAVIAVGTSRQVVQVAGHFYRHAEVLDMTATAYDATAASNGPYTGQPTAIGIPLNYGVVAVDPRVIPLGSRLYVQGYGLAIAADTGSAIKGDRIDLFFWNSPQGIAAFGIRHLKVYVLNDPRLPPLPVPPAVRAAVG